MRKRIVVAVAGLAVMSLPSGAATAEAGRKAQTPSEPGRYVVETVEYESSGGVRGFYDRKVVMKIDTATGKTWYLKDVPDKGIDSAGTTKYWIELEDYVGGRYPAFEPEK